MNLLAHRFVFAIVAAVGLAAVGCSGTGGHQAPDLTEAVVVVTINGQPLPNALVTLTPSAAGYGPDAIASGVTDDAGRATLVAAGGRPGACIGPNAVTVTDTPAPDEVRDEETGQQKAAEFARRLKNRPIPAKYANLAQSDLKLDVTKGQKDYKLELTR